MFVACGYAVLSTILIQRQSPAANDHLALTAAVVEFVESIPTTLPFEGVSHRFAEGNSCYQVHIRFP